MYGMHDLDNGQSRLWIERLMPQSFETASGIGVVDALVVRVHHWNQAHITRALNIVLPAQRVQAGARPADLTGDQGERDQATGVVRTVHMLRNAHAPKN